jgi:ABC transport system ATP-binding/permease protein
MQRLEIIAGDNTGKYIELTERPLVLGRSQGDILLSDPLISGRHARLTPTSRGWQLEDLQSTNGTLHNERPVAAPVLLAPGDKIRLGNTVLRLDPSPQAAAPVRSAGGETVISLARLKSGRSARIGRSPEVDLVLAEAIVSREHAELSWREDGPRLKDLESTNGTFVNGRLITETLLRPGDRIRIGSAELVWQEDGLTLAQKKGAIQMEAAKLSHIVWFRGKTLTLLNEVDFVVRPGEFVAIVGGSGTGKTSLFRLLTGLETPTAGEVLLNKVSYHGNQRQFSGQVGFVPQDDIVHSELTVRSALGYAARLRLPRDTSEGEYESRVEAVLAAVNLSHRADSEIKLLSGGERKRVNVALELLTEPNVLYLDEPTSGLDPHRERQMMELLSRLTKEGRTILVTTHSTLSLELCDLLLVMGPGGQMVYYGPPREALTHFGCNSYQDIYALVGETPEAARQQQRRYWQSSPYRQYIKGRCAEAPSARSSAPAERGKSESDIGAWFHQFWLLARRYLAVLANDRANGAILLFQAPVIVLIMLMVFPHNAFQVVLGEDGKPPPLSNASPIVFLLVISAIWFGTSNSVREIVKERAIFTRERLAFLFPSAYFCSKFVVLAGLCLLQCLILVLGVGAGLNWFEADTNHLLEIIGVLLLTAFVGLGLGLTLSTAVRSSDQAVSLTPVVLLPQIIFSGLFLEGSTGLVKILSKVHASYWAFGALGSLCEINHKLGQLQIKFHLNSISRKETFNGDLSVKLLALTIILFAAVAVSLWQVGRRRCARV